MGGGKEIYKAFPPMSHCFVSHTFVLTRHATTIIVAHLHSGVTWSEKASTRRSFVMYGQKDHIVSGKRLASRLFGAHYPSIYLQDSLQTPLSCSHSASTAKGINRDLTDFAQNKIKNESGTTHSPPAHITLPINHGILLTIPTAVNSSSS